MKTFISTLFFVFLLSAHAQFNKEVITDDDYQFLVGKITLDGLQSNPYKSWFETGYQNYIVDKSLVDMFKEQLTHHQIKLFLGTWCGDSKREVPRILKILDTAEFPNKNLEIIAVDRRREFYKTSPGGEEKGLNIVKVPTLIFFKNGKEINRIIERPVESLEEDMLGIIAQKKYIPNYADLKRAK